MLLCYFFFKQKAAYEMRISDCSSDVCSSDLLREKLDLANAAAPALQVEAGAERLPLREMVANPVAHRADFLELPEIEAAAPDEGVRSEEHTSELQSLMRISYAVFCLKKKNINSLYTCTPDIQPLTTSLSAVKPRLKTPQRTTPHNSNST